MAEANPLQTRRVVYHTFPIENTAIGRHLYHLPCLSQWVHRRLIQNLPANCPICLKEIEPNPELFPPPPFTAQLIEKINEFKHQLPTLAILATEIALWTLGLSFPLHFLAGAFPIDFGSPASYLYGAVTGIGFAALVKQHISTHISEGIGRAFLKTLDGLMEESPAIAVFFAISFTSMMFPLCNPFFAMEIGRVARISQLISSFMASAKYSSLLVGALMLFRSAISRLWN